MDVFDLVAKISLDDKDYKNKMGEASSFTSKIGSGIASAVSNIAKVSAVAVGAGVTAVTALTKQAVEAYASYEQLTGGVLKLFGAGTYSLEEYAQQQGKSIDEVRTKFNELMDANNAVLANADNAYKTAGMSANEYMETVTSFSASLIKSLDGDTAKSAEYADTAIRDMADNANTFGSSLESIQVAYQGFAKGNYTMLDNLKLGYGGTATEMAKLINDSGVLGDKMIDLSDTTKISAQLSEAGFAKMVEAIHVMQERMNIAGTTTREAMGTIEGSINMLKASWTNVVTNIGVGSDELGTYIDNFVESLTAVATNIMPVAERALEGIGTMVEQLAPVIASAIPTIITKVLPSLLSAGAELVKSLAQAISDNLPYLARIAVATLNQFIKGLTSSLNNMRGAGNDIVQSLGKFISESASTLIHNAVELLNALCLGIADALPTLMDTAVDIILSLVDDLLNNADNMVDGAIALVLAIADGLISNVNKISEKIPEIITKLVESLTYNAPKIIAGAIELILALASGLIEATPRLVLQIPKIIKAIVEGLINGAVDMEVAGDNLVEGLWQGIKKRWDKLVENVKNLGKNLVKSVNDLFEIKSPSRVFKRIGEYCVEGFEQGSEDMFSTDGLKAEISADVTSGGNGGLGAVVSLLEQYLPQLSNQNIYLDGDTLVSSTAQRMDMALGRLSARRV